MDRCCMCKRNWKFVDHLLHCDMAYAIWIAFLSHFQLFQVMLKHEVNLFALLVDLWQSTECCIMEYGAYMPFMEGKE